MKPKANSQEFYRDIDRQSRKKSCCTCQTMLIGFGFLFILGVAGIWQFFRAISDSGLTPFRQVAPSVKDLKSYEEKVEQIMAEAFEKKEAGSDKTVSLVITEQELTSLLASQEQGWTNDQITVKDISAAITPQQIELYGQLVKPIKTKLKIKLLPRVKDGHLEVDIKSVEAGRVRLPQLIVGELNILLEEAIQSSVEKGNITHPTGLELRDKELTITGRIN